MTRMHKTLERQLAEAQAKRDQLDQRLKVLEQRRRAADFRRRCKAEKIVLRVLLDQTAARPEFGEALSSIIRSAELKDDDRELALWLVALSASGRAASDTADAPEGAM